MTILFKGAVTCLFKGGGVGGRSPPTKSSMLHLEYCPGTCLFTVGDEERAYLKGVCGGVEPPNKAYNIQFLISNPDFHLELEP